MQSAQGYGDRPYSNPGFAELEAGQAKPCLSPDVGGASLVLRRRKFCKTVGFEYSLDFLVLFDQAKRTVATDARHHLRSYILNFIILNIM